jgi:hypothetical protein
MQRIVLSTLLALLLLTGALRAQWVQTNGPGGGEISCIAVSDAIYYAGTPKRLYRSTDAGATWRACTISDSSFTAANVSGPSAMVGTQSGHIYRSDDNGATWSAVSGPFPEATVTTLHRKGNLVFAGFFDDYGKGRNGLFVSIDGGATWNKATSGIDATSPIYDVTDNGTSIYAAGDAGVFRSTNNGADWTGPLVLGAQAIAADGSNVAAVSTSQIVVSTDNGATWSPSTTGLPTGVFLHTLLYQGGLLYCASADGIFRSNDHGSTWVPSSVGITDRDVRVLAGSGSALLAGTSVGGIHRSTNAGLAWAPSNNGIIESTTLALLGIGSRLYAGTGGGVYTTSDRGTTWSYTGLADQIYALATLHGALFAATLDSGIYRSTDNGTTWSAVNNGLSTRGRSPRTLLTVGDEIYAGGADGVYKSTDDGQLWTAQNTGITDLRGACKAMAASGGDVYAGLGGYYMNASNGTVYRSTDHGGNWTPGGLNGHDIAVLAASYPNVWAGGNSYFTNDQELYRSPDRGETWLMTPFIPDGKPHHVAALMLVGNFFYVGSDAGVFVSADNGSTFTPLNDGFSWSRPTKAFAIDDDGIYAALDGSGVWSIGTIHETGVDREQAEAVAGMSIVPNPLSGSTVIRFRTAHAGGATIEVRDLLGSRVALVADRNDAPGEHAVRVDGNGLPPGVYFCTVTTADGSRSMPMTIVR